VSNYYSGHVREYASQSKLLLKSTSLDLAKWQWISYNAILPSYFGDPTTTTSYEFCVFDSLACDPMTGSPRLLFAAPIPAGSSWQPTPSGYLFTSADRRL